MAVLERRITEEPALVLNVPRTVGKSTLLHALAGRLGRTVVDCDDPATRAAVRADRVDQSDLAGIRALRTRLGKRLATAVVLYTGALPYRFDDSTAVLPLDSLWSLSG